MAQEVRSFTITIPANTLITAGWTASLSMPPRIVERIEVRVPPGPSGLVGFAIGASGQPVIPYQQGQWIITDDEVINWPLDNMIDSGGWELFGYNTGSYPHTLHIRFHVDPVTDRNGGNVITPLNITQS